MITLPFGAGHVGFGSSIALTSDGDTALISSLGDNTSRGAAWVFTRTGNTWTQQGAELTGRGEIGPGRFGSATALSADGATAIIGGPFDNHAHGAVWTFHLAH